MKNKLHLAWLQKSLRKFGPFICGPKEILCDHGHQSESWTSLSQHAGQLLSSIRSAPYLRNEDRCFATSSFEELTYQKKKRKKKDNKKIRA